MIKYLWLDELNRCILALYSAASKEFWWKNLLSNIGVSIKFAFFDHFERKSSYFAILPKHSFFPYVFLKIFPFHFVIHIVEPLILVFYQESSQPLWLFYWIIPAVSALFIKKVSCINLFVKLKCIWPFFQKNSLTLHIYLFD